MKNNENITNWITDDGDQRTKVEFTRLLQVSNGLSLFEPDRKLGHLDWELTDGLYASLGFEHAFFNVHVTRDPASSDVNLISVCTICVSNPISFHFLSFFSLSSLYKALIYPIFSHFDLRAWFRTRKVERFFFFLNSRRDAPWGHEMQARK